MPVDVAVHCLALERDVTYDHNGSASVTSTPGSAATQGRCEVVFSTGGATVTVPLTIVAADGASPGRGQRSDAAAVLLTSQASSL